MRGCVAVCVWVWVWVYAYGRAIAYVGSSVEMRQSMQGPQTRERLGSKGRFLVIVGGRKVCVRGRVSVGIRACACA